MKKPEPTPCETCEYYKWDDDLDDNACGAYLDEDDYYRIRQNNGRCPYYKYYDEYKSVQKQN